MFGWVPLDVLHTSRASQEQGDGKAHWKQEKPLPRHPLLTFISCQWAKETHLQGPAPLSSKAVNGDWVNWGNTLTPGAIYLFGYVVPICTCLHIFELSYTTEQLLHLHLTRYNYLSYDGGGFHPFPEVRWSEPIVMLCMQSSNHSGSV